MSMTLSIAELEALVVRAFLANGMSQQNAAILGRVVTMAERDGCRTHGVFRMSGYIASLRSGWVDGKAIPKVADTGPGAVLSDASNGFSQPALEASREMLVGKARGNGIASLAIRNGHHFAALWPDVEPFAEAGFVALAFVNGRSRIAPWGAKRKVFGTDPMAFACPRKDGAPLVWDQASSVTAQGEVLLASREGKPVHEGIGIAADGRPTTDPKAILAGGAMLPFGGHKGSAIASMVELLAGGVTGSEFGVEDSSGKFPGAETSRSGEFIILIDPYRFAGDGFIGRVEFLMSHLASAGVTRLPGDRRHIARRRSEQEGIKLDRKIHDYLTALTQPDGQTVAKT